MRFLKKLKVNNPSILYSLFRAVIFAAFFISCASESVHDEGIFYKRDMKVEINKKEYIGVAVLDNLTNLKIKADFKDDGDLVRVKTCHRSEDYEQAWKEKPFFKRLSKDSAEFVISLNSPVETTNLCPLEIIAFSHSGKHTWFFALKRDAQKLGAKLWCNGQNDAYSGVSICQSQVKLIQQIQFGMPVNVRRGENCDIRRVDETTFEFYPQKGYCIARFFNEQEEEHLLGVIGYEAIKLRK